MTFKNHQTQKLAKDRSARNILLCHRTSSLPMANFDCCASQCGNNLMWQHMVKTNLNIRICFRWRVGNSALCSIRRGKLADPNRWFPRFMRERRIHVSTAHPRPSRVFLDRRGELMPGHCKRNMAKYCGQTGCCQTPPSFLSFISTLAAAKGKYRQQPNLA